MAFPFQVLILGSGSAIPNKDKNHTAQVVSYNSKKLLFDCGEGTQVQMKKFGVSLQKIDHIFISHLHGDHYLGLAGLVSSMNLLGREKKLFIYGPSEIKQVIDLHFQLANSRSSFYIEYIDTISSEDKKLILETDQMRVYAFPVRHKIPTMGFLVSVGSRKRKLIKEELEKHQVPRHLRTGIAAGKDFVNAQGKVIKNKDLTTAPENEKQYAYCADTSYLPALEKILKGVDLLYHEASFLKEDQKRAKLHLHSTAEQAAKLANDCKVKKLIIGHYSNKYNNDQAFLKEARSVFPETYHADEGSIYEIT